MVPRSVLGESDIYDIKERDIAEMPVKQAKVRPMPAVGGSFDRAYRWG